MHVHSVICLSQDGSALLTLEAVRTSQPGIRPFNGADRPAILTLASLTATPGVIALHHCTCLHLCDREVHPALWPSVLLCHSRSYAGPPDAVVLETLQHYMHYCLGAYGWPLLVFDYPLTGLLTLIRRCFSRQCCCPSGSIRQDNCCHCHAAALRSRVLSSFKLSCPYIPSFGPSIMLSLGGWGGRGSSSMTLYCIEVSRLLVNLTLPSAPERELRRAVRVVHQQSAQGGVLHSC